jgi:hypothetical protein
MKDEEGSQQGWDFQIRASPAPMSQLGDGRQTRQEVNALLCNSKSSKSTFTIVLSYPFQFFFAERTEVAGFMERT